MFRKLDLFPSSAIEVSSLALSKGPNRVGVSFSLPEDANEWSFRTAVFSSLLEFWTMVEVLKLCDS
jgi:hypothetical protein